MKILFLGYDNSCRSLMAQVMLESMEIPDVSVYSAGLAKAPVDSRVVQVMGELGLDMTAARSKEVSEVLELGFDLIITLSSRSHEVCSRPTHETDSGKSGSCSADIAAGLFRFDPFYLYWPIPRPDPGSQESLRNVRDLIKESVENLVNHGYLRAFASKKKNTDKLLDMIDEGVIVHDRHRKILRFNRAAERITGVSREEALGKDCHDVFKPRGLCKGECPFEFGPATPPDMRKYTTTITDTEGKARRLNMSTTSLDMGPVQRRAVLITMKDVTDESLEKIERTAPTRFHGMVGRSRVMREIFYTIQEVAKSNYAVLVSGESGTGKELAARAIHEESSRKDGPFVPINCGALPEHILESELFGHVKGAFTGAIRDKKGRFELADGGTLFLDEIGELSPSLQVHLLRVLQEQRFEKVGGEKTITVDVRIVSATNKNLKELVRQGKFREDLYYRLCVVPIHLPPLRDRTEDIPMLVEHVIEQIRRETGKEMGPVSQEVMNRFKEYPWPGNVRELVNALQFASIYCNGSTIEMQHLPPEIRGPSTQWQAPAMDLAVQESPATNLESGPRRAKLDARSIREALQKTGGNKAKAAKLLGVGRATLYRFLKEDEELRRELINNAKDRSDDDVSIEY